jgi:nucleotide-binding universal stress UspA family protein
MAIKDILLIVRPGVANETLFAVAAAAAQAQGAVVHGLGLVEEPPLTVAESFARGSAAIDEVLVSRAQHIQQQASAAQGKFEQAMAAARVQADWRASEADEPVETTAVRARYADLVVAAQPGEHDHDGRALVEALVLDGGAPVLVAPQSRTDGAGFNRVVLAWDGGLSARRALDASLPFLAAAQRVEVAVVDEGNASGVDETALEALLRRLARHGVRAEARRLGPGVGDAGAALLSHAATFDADLLVMGAFGHSRAVEAIVGGVTRTVLARAGLPVLLAH